MFPIDLDFKMPPEWVQHARTFMEWPLKKAVWPEPFIEILSAYAEIVKTIARFEPVTLLAHPDSIKEAAAYCQNPDISILEMQHNDSWARDNGPTFLRNSRNELAGVNWIFNGWGEKYPADKDNRIAPNLLNYYGVPSFNAPLVMEGGSFHVDGEGTLITTEECLLHSNRNPQLSKDEIEEYLKKYLGVTKIIWLKRGWSGDDTDGHIDNVACFARPGVIMAQVCSEQTDANYEISQENLEILKTATDAGNRTLEIIQIEQPSAVYYDELRLTLSYLNFYFVNGGIIMPVFDGGNSATDQAAVKTLQRTFPDREIATVNGLIIARGGGNVHCLTQQMPEGNSA